MELDNLDHLEIKGYLAYWLVRHLANLFSSLNCFHHSVPELILSSLVVSHVSVVATTWGLSGLSLSNGAA